MPILDVEMVLSPGEGADADLASRLADAAGEVFGTPAGRTWVRLRCLPGAHYAESGGGPPEGIRPIFVHVLLAIRPAGEALRALTTELTEAVASTCGRSEENVHVLWLEDAAERMAFGGRLVEPPSGETEADGACRG